MINLFGTLKIHRMLYSSMEVERFTPYWEANAASIDRAKDLPVHHGVLD